MHTMATFAEDAGLTEVMNLLEAEPGTSASNTNFIAGPDIPALREQLTILVATGKTKEAIGVQLTHEQVKRLSEQEVEKYCKIYTSYVGGKTTENLIESFLMVATKVAGMVLYPSKTLRRCRKSFKVTTSSQMSSPLWLATLL